MDSEKSNLYGMEVAEFCNFFEQFLHIIGYESDDAVRFIFKFMGLVEVEFLEKVERRLSSEARETFNRQFKEIINEMEAQGLKVESDFFKQQSSQERLQKVHEIIEGELSIKQMQILYSETYSDLFEEYLDSVIPETTPNQRKEIEALASSFGLKL
jgi:hypothetical protein